MSTPIVFEIPSDLHEDDWKEYLSAHLHEFDDALDKSVGVDPWDARLTIDGVTVDTLEIWEDKVFVNYTVSWSFYAGCEDANGAGDEEHFVAAHRQGSVLTFERHIPPTRSTFEEF